MSLIPINNCVLVKLTDVAQLIDVPDTKFATQATGLVIDVSNEIENKDIVGKMVYFEEYRDSAQVEVDEDKYAFIKYEDIRGYDE